MPKDYYIVLGVSRGADLNKIKKAYRTIAKRFHPDLSRSDENAERFLEIKEAYETLGDDARRRQHDEELGRQVSGLKVKTAPEVIRERTFFTRTDDFFSGFLPGFFDVEKGRLRDKDLYYEAILSPLEALEGGLFPVTVPVMELCTECSGPGMGEDLFCPVCRGYGRVRGEREFSLSIPPNVKQGTEIRLSLEDIGLHDTYLNILVRIEPYGEVDW